MPTPLYPILPYQAPQPTGGGGGGGILGFLDRKRQERLEDARATTGFDRQQASMEAIFKANKEAVEQAKKDVIELEKISADVENGKQIKAAHLKFLVEKGIDPSMPPEVMQPMLVKVYAGLQDKIDQDAYVQNRQTANTKTEEAGKIIDAGNLSKLDSARQDQVAKSAINLAPGATSIMQNAGAPPSLAMGQSQFQLKKARYNQYGQVISEDAESGMNPPTIMGQDSRSLQEIYHATDPNAGGQSNSPVNVAPGVFPVSGQQPDGLPQFNMPINYSTALGSPVNVAPQQQSPNGIIPQIGNEAVRQYMDYIGNPFARGAQGAYNYLWKGQQ